MNKLTREDVKNLLVLVIGIALIVIAIRFFIYILPFIIVALVIWLIYDSYKKNKDKPNKGDKKIKEAQVIKEKNNE